MIQRYNAEHVITDGDDYKIVRSSLADDDSGLLVTFADHQQALSALEEEMSDLKLKNSVLLSVCDPEASLTSAQARIIELEMALRELHTLIDFEEPIDAATAITFADASLINAAFARARAALSPKEPITKKSECQNQ